MPCFFCILIEYSFSFQPLISLFHTSGHIIGVHHTSPCTCLAAIPIVCIKEVSDLKNPSLSASKIATKPTSGRSKPSLNKLIPTKTSYSLFLNYLKYRFSLRYLCRNANKLLLYPCPPSIRIVLRPFF